MKRFVCVFACLMCSAFAADGPDAQYPRSAGELKALLQILSPASNDTKELYLSRVRQYRLICNVPHENLTWNDEQEKLADAAAGICAKLGKLTHNPERPAGMSDADYELGKKGAGTSNLFSGVTKPAACVNGWMDDSDDSNIDRVGHRRWILNPRMGQSAFGAVGNFAAMYAFDGSRKDVPDWDFVAYPARGYMPTSYFGNRYAWSVSINTAKYATPNKESVTVTIQPVDVKNSPQGSPLKIDRFFVETGGFGSGPAIIFRPETFKMAHDQRFNVTVSGLKLKTGKDGTIDYIVHFVDLNKIPDGADGKAANTAYFIERMNAAKDTADEYDRLLQYVSITESKFLANADPSIAKDAKAAATDLMKKPELRKEYEASQKYQLAVSMEQKAGKDKAQIFAAAAAYRSISTAFKGTRAGQKAADDFERLKAQYQ
jgi:hypothetical protein